MESVELYNKAVLLIEEVRKVSLQTADEKDASVCVIVTSNNEICAGVTGLKISDGKVSKACSEYNAIMSMIASGCVTAEKMITVSCADGSVCCPCGDCIDMLCRADEKNAQCEIAVSAESSVKAFELKNSTDTPVFSEESPTVSEESPAVSLSENIPAFSSEPVSENLSFEEKFGFDFDDTPATPVPTLANQTESQPVYQQTTASVPEQNNSFQFMEQYQSGGVQQNMDGQFVHPNFQPYSQNMQNNYPQQPQGYPQPQMYSGQMQQGGMNPQFIQPNMQQPYSQNIQQQPYSQNMQGGYPQPYSQPVNPSVNQGNFPSNANPYYQQQINSQPFQNVYPNQSSMPTASPYQSSVNMSVSQPITSVTLSGEGKSKFRQRLSKFMSDDDMPVSSVSKEEGISKSDIKKQARDKKKMAKVNADFKKRMKDLGY
ncbi:MAG: hypothetical protein K2G14_05155 [Ruminococcus sp.]|nr:hypothetical protein [Ruminococcus sp.]